MLITCMVWLPMSPHWIQGVWRGATEEFSASLHVQSFISTNFSLRVEAKIKRPVEYSPKATLCDLASKLRRHDPLLRKQRRSLLLITCTVLCVSLMGTGAGQSVRRLPLSAMSKDSQLDVADCDSPRTKASKFRRHNPMLPEQRGPRCLSPAWSVYPFHGCGSKVSGAVPHRNVLHRSTARALFQQTSR